MIELRPGRQDDIQAVAELWTHTFPGTRPLAERIATLETGGLHGGIETVRVAESGGRLVGALKTIPFTQFLSGAELPMMGLAAVGVAPWARRQGVGGAMCGEALRSAQERGEVVSALYPFRPAFYERLGWGLTGSLSSYRFAPEALPEFPDPGVRLAAGTDHEAIRRCYERVAVEASSGLIARDEAQWDAHLTTPGTHAFLVGESEVGGYMIVRYGQSRSADHRPLWIREMIAVDAAARDRLLGWVSLQRDLFRRVRYDATADEYFGHRLSDPRPPGYRGARWLWAETAVLLRGPMYRVLDVERAMSLRRRWGGSEAFSFGLTVRDAQLPENAGPWRVEYDGRSLSIERADVGPGGGPRLEVDAATFAVIYAGELPVSGAVSLGRARLDGPVSGLDALFGTERSFRLLDEF